MITGGYEGQMAFSEDNYHHPQQGPQRQQEPQLDSISSPTATSSSPVTTTTSRSQMKCNHKGCTVGRNHAKRSSWFRQKIHFVDVSKLRHPKLCMKTTLVGDDCKPLLIQAGEDVNVPLANRVTNGEPEKKHNNRNSPNNKGHCGKCGLLLDALARTFCLPLLGWSLIIGIVRYMPIARICLVICWAGRHIGPNSTYLDYIYVFIMCVYLRIY